MNTTAIENRLHGRQVFQRPNSLCDCHKCDAKRAAVKQLVDSFSRVPHRWITVILDITGEPPVAPMWGSLFIPHDQMDIRQILTLVAEHDNREHVDRQLYDAGWKEVAQTGVLCRTVDHELVLGIDGAGYDFYHIHWEPLYDALGYRWHIPHER